MNRRWKLAIVEYREFVLEIVEEETTGGAGHLSVRYSTLRPDSQGH